MRRAGIVIGLAMFCMLSVSCGQTKQEATESKNINPSSGASVTTSTSGDFACNEYASMSTEEITKKLTLEQKAAQMVQGAVYSMEEKAMQQYCYGSILSKYDSLDYATWQKVVDGYQKAALSSEAGIPYLYGNDDVHGVNYCRGAVIFPHNIGIGAAHDTELTYQMGKAVGDEAKLCHML